MLIINGMFQAIIFLMILTGLAYSLSIYLSRLYQKNFLGTLCKEKWLSDGLETNECSGRNLLFQISLLLLLGLLFLTLLQVLQGDLPLNPQNYPGISWDKALLNACFCITNNGWFSENSEVPFSYLTHLGFTSQVFIYTALNIAVAIYFIKSLVVAGASAVENLWVYFWRTLIFLLLPLAVIFATLNLWQGVPNSYGPSIKIVTLEGKRDLIPQGPIATHLGIKNLSSNGGGWFAANAAHPFENPTAFTDYLNGIAQLLISVALPFFLARSLKKPGIGWVFYSIMVSLYLMGLLVLFYSERKGIPILQSLGVSGGENLAGREVRFGVLSSLISSQNALVSSVGSSTGLINYFSPLGYLIFIINLSLGEVIFGGAGTGCINLLFFLLFAIFLIGQMVGRSLELLGKKIESYDLKLLMIALFLPPILVLSLSSVEAIWIPGALSAHQLTGLIYHWLSVISNNGSFLATVNLNYPLWNGINALLCLIGYFLKVGIGVLLSCSFFKKTYSAKINHFSWNNSGFVFFMLCTILATGALAYFPTLVCGPIFELLNKGI